MIESLFVLDCADLEIRAKGAGRALFGSFPYGKTATVKDRGKVRKERFKKGAFGWQFREFSKLQKKMARMIEESADKVRRELIQEQLERRNVHILAGHDFGKPLGSMMSGAKIRDTDKGVDFEVDLPPEAKQPSWVKDAVLQIEAGTMGGISPGFRVPPASAVANAEELIDEPGNPGVKIRQVNQAVLFELSLVTRPAYGQTEVDLRADELFGSTEPTEPQRRRRRLWL